MAYMYQKSRADLFLELQNKLSDSGIKDASVDSMANILADFLVTELTSISSEFNNQLGELDIETAEGDALDSLALSMYGLRRFEASEAIARDNMRISNTSGDTITIEEGTRFSDGSSYNEDGVVYEAIEEVAIETGNFAYVTVRSLFEGSNQNVNSNVLTNMNVSLTGVECGNRFPIVNGADRETDGNFKVRINNYLSAVVNQNIEYLRYRVLEVPGVYNVKFFQGYRGLGTLSLFATTSGYKTNAQIKSIIESRIEEVKLPGEAIFYEEGERLLFDIKMKLINDRAFSNAEIEQIKFDIRKLFSEELVKSKKSGVINFASIENAIKRNLTAYNFSYNDNDSIYVYKRYSYANNANSGGTLDASSYTLAIPEIPEISKLEIEVELNL